MNRLKRLVKPLTTILLIAAVVFFVKGFLSLSDLPAASEYEDDGVHTFAVKQIVPVQVKNTARGRSRRLHPTKTVYMIDYKTTDGSGYLWRREGSSAESLARQMAEDMPTVERRVLLLPADDTYITVEADQTAESYTAQMKRQYQVMMGAAALYAIVYVSVQLVRYQRSRNATQATL